MRFWLDWGASDSDITADQAILNSGIDMAQGTVLQNDGMFNLTILDDDMMKDAGKWSNVAVYYSCSFPYDCRSSDNTIDYFGSFLNCYTAANFTISINIAIYMIIKLFQYQIIGFKHITWGASVDPPTPVNIRMN